MNESELKFLLNNFKQLDILDMDKAAHYLKITGSFKLVNCPQTLLLNKTKLKVLHSHLRLELLKHQFYKFFEVIKWNEYWFHQILLKQTGAGVKFTINGPQGWQAKLESEIHVNSCKLKRKEHLIDYILAASNCHENEKNLI